MSGSNTISGGNSTSNTNQARTKEFAAFHLRVRYHIPFMQQHRLISPENVAPSAFDLLGLSGPPKVVDGDTGAPAAAVEAAFQQVDERLRELATQNAKVASELRTALAFARRIVSEPSTASDYNAWYHAQFGNERRPAAVTPATTTPTNAPAAPAAPPLSAAASAKREMIVAGGAFGAIALLAVILMSGVVRVGGAKKPLPGDTVAVTAASLEVVGADLPSTDAHGAYWDGADPTGQSGTGAITKSRADSARAKELLNEVAAELTPALDRQRQGKMTAAEAAVLRTGLEPKCREALAAAESALNGNPENQAAHYQRVLALYYLEKHVEAGEHVRRSLERFPDDSDLKTMKALIDSRTAAR